MSKSMLLVPVQEDELSQPLYVEGVHNPDELARASGVWIAAAGSAMLPTGVYNVCDTERWLWFAVENGLVQLENDEVSYTLRGGDCCMLPPATRGVTVTASQEARVLWMTVDGVLSSAFLQRMGALPHRVMKQGALPSQLNLGRHIVQAIVRIAAAQDASSAQLQQLLWAMLASHSGQPVAMDAVLSHEIARVVDAMRKNQYRDSFSLAEWLPSAACRWRPSASALCPRWACRRRAINCSARWSVPRPCSRTAPPCARLASKWA